MYYLSEIPCKILRNKTIFSPIVGNIPRFVSSTIHKRQLNITCQVEKLTTRGLLKVSGDDVAGFMQGLITNDIRHFESGSKSLYTMFLNTKGRVMFDSIIYMCPSLNDLLIECDAKAVESLEKHLKLFRVRRKIDVKAINDQLQIWVLFNPLHVEQINKASITHSNKKDTLQERVVPCTIPQLENQGQQFLNDLLLGENISLYSDPRISTLGTRVLAPIGQDIVKAVKNTGITVQETETLSYKMFRYSLGIGEGIEELPQGKCFPLEVNCDYLHGVSFHKGCYIGQELTARTHHTGVVRKRLMPLLLDYEISHDIHMDAPIEDAEGKKTTSVGKLRGVENNVGIGLLRIAEALELSKLKVGGVPASTVKPFWWPQELPKERMDLKKD